MHHVKGWGHVIKAPISEIYCWDNINEGRRKVATEMKFGKAQTTKTDAKNKILVLI